jgi:hypothetical protein
VKIRLSIDSQINRRGEASWTEHSQINRRIGWSIAKLIGGLDGA